MKPGPSPALILATFIYLFYLISADFQYQIWTGRKMLKALELSLFPYTPYFNNK